MSSDGWRRVDQRDRGSYVADDRRRLAIIGLLAGIALQIDVDALEPD